MSMSVGERDKKMNMMASVAAEAFCEMHTPLSPDHIRNDPKLFLEHTVPCLTVRTLQKLHADSRWIKWFAIITGILTLVLVGLTIGLLRLTIVLANYASRLDTITQSSMSVGEPSNESPTPSPTPAEATATPAEATATPAEATATP